MNHSRNPPLVSWGIQLRIEHGRCKVRQLSEFKNIYLVYQKKDAEFSILFTYCIFPLPQQPAVCSGDTLGNRPKCCRYRLI